MRLVQELLLLKKFYAAKAASRDKVALGAKETMAAIENKTAQTVIVYDDLRVNRVAGGGRVVYWEESTPRTEVEELGKDVEEENLLHWLLLNASKVTASGATIEVRRPFRNIPRHRSLISRTCSWCPRIVALALSSGGSPALLVRPVLLPLFPAHPRSAIKKSP